MPFISKTQLETNSKPITKYLLLERSSEIVCFVVANTNGVQQCPNVNLLPKLQQLHITTARLLFLQLHIPLSLFFQQLSMFPPEIFL